MEDPMKHVLDGGAHWCNLVNTIELSMCGSNVAFLSNYFDHLLLLSAEKVRELSNIVNSYMQDSQTMHHF